MGRLGDSDSFPPSPATIQLKVLYTFQKMLKLPGFEVKGKARIATWPSFAQILGVLSGLLTGLKFQLLFTCFKINVKVVLKPRYNPPMWRQFSGLASGRSKLSYIGLDSMESCSCE